MTEHRRGLALSASTHGYAVAAATLGATPLRIYGRHILPNIASALIANMILNFPGTTCLGGVISGHITRPPYRFLPAPSPHTLAVEKVPRPLQGCGEMGPAKTGMAFSCNRWAPVCTDHAGISSTDSDCGNT